MSRIIESYKVPSGNVSLVIFGLPCITSAYKTMKNEVYYHVEDMIAHPGDWICKWNVGGWEVISDDQYQELMKEQDNDNQ